MFNHLESSLKRVILSCIVNIVIPATILAKKVAKISYSLLEDLYGMQGFSGSSPLGYIKPHFPFNY